MSVSLLKFFLYVYVSCDGMLKTNILCVLDVPAIGSVV